MNHTLHSAALKKYSYKACDIRTLLGNHCTGTVIIFIRLSQMICCVFLLSNEDIVLETTALSVHSIIYLIVSDDFWSFDV